MLLVPFLRCLLYQTLSLNGLSLTSLLTVYLYTHSFHWTTNLRRSRIVVAPPRLSQILRQKAICFTCLLYLTFHLSYLTARKSGNVSCGEPLLIAAVFQVAIIDTFLGTSDFKSESERLLSSSLLRDAFSICKLIMQHAARIPFEWHLNTLKSWRKLFFHALSGECSQHPG